MSKGEHPPVVLPGPRSRHLPPEANITISNENADDEEGIVWQHNAWDDLQWTAELEAAAEARLLEQQQQPQKITKASAKPSVLAKDEGAEWDKFYEAHDRWFFKDRKWLPIEFPELFCCQLPHASSESKDADRLLNVLEVGCGAGNTVWPLLRNNLGAKVWACDFSGKAVDLVTSHREFDPDRLCVFQHDLGSTRDNFPEGMPQMDIVVAVFVLSALSPIPVEQTFSEENPSPLQVALKKIHGILKPGGLLLFRDYGRLDLTQLRMPPERFLGTPDCYRRGDGTLVHYFSEHELKELFKQENGWSCIRELRSDRRLIVNRKRQLLMCRVWIQGKFQKAPSATESENP